MYICGLCIQHACAYEVSGCGVYVTHTHTNTHTHTQKLCGAVAGQTVVSINGTPIDPRNPSEFLDVLKPKSRSPLPLHLSVIKSSSQLCTLVPSSGGLGFHIKGSSPVIIHEVDKGIIIILAYE